MTFEAPIAYAQVRSLARQLGATDRLRLIEALFHDMRQEISAPKKHSIRELRGLGKEIWKDIDVATYIQQERDSWDG